MRKILQRLLQRIPYRRIAVLCPFFVAIIVVLRHLLDTPQPLESMLSGEPHLFRWNHGHIFFTTSGDKSTPPMVLLHAPGLATSSSDLRQMQTLLTQNYFLYIPDLLGFGLSDRPYLEYSAEMYITLYHDFLTNVVRQPAIIVASGLSCNYASLVAKRYPECCTHLILLPSHDMVISRGVSRLFSGLLTIPTLNLVLFAFLSTRPMLRFFHSLSTRQHIATSELNHLYATTHRFGAEHAPMALLRGALTVDAESAFDALTQPTLLICEVKALHTLRLLTHRYALSDTIEMIIIQDAGTAVPETLAESVVTHIHDWLSLAKTEHATGQ